MKKTALIIVFIIGIVFIGSLAISAQTGDSWFYPNTYPYSNNWGMHGRQFYGYCQDDFDEQPSYEWLYFHLSLEDQNIVDLKYLELVSAYDIETMTAIEQEQLIDEIKLILVDFIEEQDFDFETFR
ncbi:MAG: hypothetical protein KKG64_03095 [Firmicutes bacterium]|nr:hypothetical protein [Bacillota bacterium]